MLSSSVRIVDRRLGFHHVLAVVAVADVADDATFDKDVAVHDARHVAHLAERDFAAEFILGVGLRDVDRRRGGPVPAVAVAEGDARIAQRFGIGVGVGLEDQESVADVEVPYPAAFVVARVDDLLLQVFQFEVRGELGRCLSSVAEDRDAPGREVQFRVGEALLFDVDGVGPVAGPEPDAFHARESVVGVEADAELVVAGEMRSAAFGVDFEPSVVRVDQRDVVGLVGEHGYGTRAALPIGDVLLLYGPEFGDAGFFAVVLFAGCEHRSSQQREQHYSVQ